MKPPEEKAQEILEGIRMQPHANTIYWEDEKYLGQFICDQIIEAIEMFEEDIALSPVNPYYLPDSKVEYWNQIKERFTK